MVERHQHLVVHLGKNERRSPYGGDGDPRPSVELAGEHTQGMTVMDWRCRTGRAPNCLVFREVDHERFFALLTERLGRL
mgnify:CR=1 FL=1